MDSGTENVATIRELLKAWNSRDLDRIGKFFHPDFENHQAPFPPVVGRDAYLRHCRDWFEAFEGFWIEEVTIFGSGDLVCLEARGGGRRKAPFFGLVPSDEEEVVHSCDVFEFRDGLIAMERGYWDFSMATGECAPARETA